MSAPLWTLYCDEAGNAGSNYWDVQQPFHVEAGWLVPQEKHAAFEAVVAEALAERIARVPGTVELKGKTLLKSHAGQRVAYTVVRGLLGLGCIPMFILAERRFCAAGKAVDVFLDNHTNPDANRLLLWGAANRLALWERVGAISDRRLRPFATAYRQPTLGSLDTALTELVDGLAERGDTDLAAVLELSRRHLSRILEYETLDSFGLGLGHPLWAALNVPVFFHLAKRADFVAEHAGSARLRVVHDAVSKFDVAFSDMVQRLAVPTGSPRVVVEESGHHIYVGVREQTSVEFGVSHDILGLQAADVLASTVARTSRLAAMDQPWTDGLTRLAMNVLPPLLEDQPAFCGAMASEAMMAKLMVRLIQEGMRRGIEPG